MQLSTKGRYAVMAMADLANATKNASVKAVTLAEIANRQDLSLTYLEQIFLKLRRAGLVNSIRGPGGGYKLALNPEDILIANIMSAVDEPVKITRCVENDKDGCVAGQRCLTHDLWAALGSHLINFLANVSLQDVIDGNLKTGVRHKNVEKSDVPHEVSL